MAQAVAAMSTQLLSALPNASPTSCKSPGSSPETLAFSSSQLVGCSMSNQLSVRSSGGIRRAQRLVVRADGEKEGEEGSGAGFGLGGPGTWFGFGPRQERNVGRLGMMGFASALVMEVVTGKGVLGQLGVDPSAIRFPLLAGIAFLFIAGLLGGYTVVNNPPDLSKAPANEGAGLPRNPLKTFDAKTPDPLTMYSRGGVVDREGGQKGREPYVSDLELPDKK